MYPKKCMISKCIRHYENASKPVALLLLLSTEDRSVNLRSKAAVALAYVPLSAPSNCRDKRCCQRCHSTLLNEWFCGCRRCCGYCNDVAVLISADHCHHIVVICWLHVETPRVRLATLLKWQIVQMLQQQCGACFQWQQRWMRFYWCHIRMFHRI